MFIYIAAPRAVLDPGAAHRVVPRVLVVRATFDPTAQARADAGTRRRRVRELQRASSASTTRSSCSTATGVTDVVHGDLGDS